MLTVYRIETFTRNGFNPRSMAVIESPEISFDYLTLESTKVICKEIDAEWGDWARIIDQDGNIVYTGIINNIIANETSTEVDLNPLQFLFSVNTNDQYLDAGTAYNNAEVAIQFTFRRLWDVTADSFREIPVQYNRLTTTPCPITPKPTNTINNEWSYVTYLLKQTGVAANMGIDLANKQLVIDIGVPSDQIIIETDKDYVLDFEVSEGSNQGYNEVQMYDENDVGAGLGIYVLHPDGTVDKDVETDRISPVVFCCDVAQAVVVGGTYPEDQPYALEKAKELLQMGKWVNEVRITLSNDNKVIDVNSPIGSKAIILNNDIAYETILTGFIKKGNTTTLLFGTIRSELTKQMAINRINTGDAFQLGNGGGTSSLNLMPNQEIQIGTYNSKAMFAQVIAWSNGAIPATTLVKIGSLNCEVDEVISVDFNATPSNRVYFWAGSVRDGGVYHQGIRITRSNGDVYYHYNDAWSNGTMIKAFIMYTKV